MWRILFYEDHRGKSPVLDFINNLTAKDRAIINNMLRLLEEFGTDLEMPHARRIKGRLWELRPGDNRLFYCMQMKSTFILLHGYRKRSRKAPEKEIATALRRMQEVLEEQDVAYLQDDLSGMASPAESGSRICGRESGT